MESTSTGAQGNLKAPASSTEKTSSANDSSNRTLAKDVVPLKDLPQAPRQLLDNAHLNGDSSSTRDLPADADESVYHLPPGLQDLIQSFEATKSRVSQPQNAAVQRLLAASHSTCPDASDAEKPRHFKPQTRYNTPAHYPQEAPAVFDDPRLYSRIDTDTLFYVFYYRQNTYQQYLAAKALKSQSWRFHKQYQTWFQRHEEPKTITEEFEQGTYRFFDYESTWYVAASAPCKNTAADRDTQDESTKTRLSICV
jgi:CCR4-NOT transcription complex subunit 3